jgi:protein gp37
MADNTKIEWADATLNYANGCSRVSPGCGGPGPHGGCYAELLAGTRLRHHPSRAGLTKQTSAGPRWTGEVRMHEPALQLALQWKRGRKIFWNAHGDLFHENVPDEAIDRLFAVCGLTPQHTHMILTKRADRMREYLSARKRAKPINVTMGDGTLAQHPFNNELKAPANVWLGVSVEDQERADERIPHLLATPAAVRFISAEPLLGPMDITCLRDNGDTFMDALVRHPNMSKDQGPLDWVIVGGESGPKARPMHPDWVRSLREQCLASATPFLFKQWGEYHPSRDHDPAGCTNTPDAIHVSSDREFRPMEAGWLISEEGNGWEGMCRVGKKAAGRLLDGREWTEFPR